MATQANKYLRSGLFFSIALAIMHFPILFSICAYILERHHMYLHSHIYSFFSGAALLAIPETGLLAYLNYLYIRKMEKSANKKYNVFLLLVVNISFSFLLLENMSSSLGDSGMLWAITALLLSLPWLIFILFSASSHLVQCTDLSSESKIPQE